MLQQQWFEAFFYFIYKFLRKLKLIDKLNFLIYELIL